MTIKKNILIILVFIFTVLALFINKLTSPRVLSENELLINGLFLFETPKQISDFTFLPENNIEFTVPAGVSKAKVVFYKPLKDPMLPGFFLDDVVILKKP